MLAWLRLVLLSPPACRDPEVLRAAVQGKTILITGASYGIGEATASLLAQAGAEVVLVARTADRLREVCETIRQRGGKASFYRLDLSQPDEIASAVAQIQADHPRLHAVISNAGKSISRPVMQSMLKRDLERQLAVNFSGPAALILALLPRLTAQGGGVIVNVSSLAAKTPGSPRWGAYQGTKAGFDVWFHSLGAELHLQGLRVASIYLPLTRTRMSAPTKAYRFLPALSADEAAQAVVLPLVRPARRVAPWWLGWLELVALLFPSFTARVLSASEVVAQRFSRRGRRA